MSEAARCCTSSEIFNGECLKYRIHICSYD